MTKAAPLKILIVDDHVALRRTVRQMFEGSDIVFLEAASGEEAVKIFAFEHPAGRGGNPTPARSEFSLKSGVT